MSKQVVAIDVSNFVYKEYFGMKAGDDKNTDTIVADCVDRILRKARAVQRRGSVCYLAFDSKGDTFRHEIYPDYKAGRMTEDEDKRAIKTIIHLAEIRAIADGIRISRVEGYEADDVLASIARQCRAQGQKVGIVSADKDLYSLLNLEGVYVFKFIKSHGHNIDEGTSIEFADRVTADDVWKRFAVEPFQWLDYRCLVGDTSDNIKGLHGIGPKKASSLLGLHFTLTDLFKNWNYNRGFFSDKDRAKFEKFRDEELPVLRRLFRLVDDLDVLQH